MNREAKKSLVSQWTCYFSSANHHSFIFQCLILHVYWSVNNTRNFCVHLYNFSFLNIYVHDKRNKGGEEKEQDLGASVQETVWTVMSCRHIEVYFHFYWLWWAALCYIGLYWAVLVCIWLHWAVLDCTWLFWNVVDCTGLHWTVLGYTGRWRAVLGCGRMFWAVLGCTGLYWTVLGCTKL